MGKFRRDEEGFSAVELLLALIFTAIVAFIGVYVAHNHDASKPAPTSTIGSAKDASIAPTPSDAAGRFVFKELGVQVTLPDDLKGLTYTKNTYSTDEIYDVTTPEFKQLAAQCGDSAPTGFADVFKKSGQFSAPGNEGSNGLLKQFDSYYIGYGDGLYGNPCEQSIYDQLVGMQAKLNNSLKTAFATATKI
jgi:hypothetical protein